MPWPKEVVASLHFPHLKGMGMPISSMSNSILLITFIFIKKDLNFSIPIFWPILTEPIFPDLIKIYSAVKSDGILLSYSPILYLSHLIDLGKSINSVSGFITFSFKALAKVKALKTEPSS